MSTTAEGSAAELHSLRLLRAALESTRQLAAAVHTDVETLLANYRGLAHLEDRLDAVVRYDADAEGDAEAEAKPKRTSNLVMGGGRRA